MVKLFKVVFSPKSRQRLKDISDYYQTTASDSVAKKVRKGIVEEAIKLEKLPDSKPILPNTEDFDPPVRYTKKWSFKIIFSIFKKKDEVLIETIRHDKELPESVRKDIER